MEPSRPLRVSFIAFSRGCVGGEDVIVLLGEDENKIKSTLSLSLLSRILAKTNNYLVEAELICSTAAD